MADDTYLRVGAAARACDAARTDIANETMNAGPSRIVSEVNAYPELQRRFCPAALAPDDIDR